MKVANCPVCLLKLEISDDPVECPCCDSLLKPARWEPPAFEVARRGDILETPAKKKERIKYEGEIAKLSYRELDGGRTKISEIDISALSRALRVIRRLDHLLVINCGFTLMGVVAAPIGVPKFRSELVLAVYSVIAAILIVSVCVGYRHVGVIDERAWNNYVIVLPLLLLFYILEIAGLFILEIVEIFLSTKGIRVSSIEDVPIDSRVFIFLYSYVQGLLALAGFVSVLRLRRMRVPRLGISLVEMLSELRSRSEPLPRCSNPVRCQNAPLGIFLAATGGVVIIAGVTLPILILDRQSVSAGIAFNILPSVAGWVLLMRSRRYFQINADSLLSVDKRRPILFLRSFDDDHRLRYTPPIVSMVKRFLDFSLETRLSNHFPRFGPFIAVGVPNEVVPVRGAARIILANQEWLPTVADWMTEASLIVMYAGRTNWVSWELAKIIEMGSVHKLMLIIPEVAGEARAVRAENVSLRIERLSEILNGTRWSNSFAELHNVEDVRAMLLRDDGSVVVLRSRPHNRDSYHLATLIAHYIMINQAASLPLLD
jgi:hypothetical protein